jgi:hypothetical protein
MRFIGSRFRLELRGICFYTLASALEAIFGRVSLDIIVAFGARNGMTARDILPWSLSPWGMG